MKLHQEEADVMLTNFPEVNTFIEKCQKTTMYGKFLRVCVTIGARFPIELSKFTFKFILPVVIIYDRGEKQVYNIEYRKTMLYQELTREDFSEFALRVIENELIKEFKRLMLSDAGINNVVLVRNEFPVGYEDDT